MKEKKKYWFVIIVIIAITAISIYKIQLGLHFDESLGIAMAMMMGKGAVPVRDCWSTLQMTTSFTALPAKLFLAINGNTEGILLFFRCIYLLIQMIFSYFTYRVFARYVDKRCSSILALFVFLYCYNWMSVTYKSLMFWCLLGMILMLLEHYSTGKRRYLILAALFLCGAVISYPTTVLVFLPIVLWLKGKENKRLFVGVCVALGIAFLLILIGRAGWAIFWKNLPEILHADAYTGNTPTKILKQFGACAVCFLLVNLPFVFFEILARKADLQKWRGAFLVCYLIVMIIGAFGLRAGNMNASRAWYVFCPIFSWCLYLERVIPEEKEDLREIRKLLYFTSLFAMIAVGFATNQSFVTMVFPSVFGVMGVLMKLWREPQKSAHVFVGICLVLSSFCYLFFVPDQEGGNRNILEKRVLVESGPAKGLRLKPENKEAYMEFIEAISEETGENDRVCLIGDNHMATGYLAVSGEYATYSPYDVPIETEKLRDFFEGNPDKIPTVAILDTKVVPDLEEWEKTATGDYLTKSIKMDKIEKRGRFTFLR